MDNNWKLVPVEPTREMLDVGVKHAMSISLSGDYRWHDYMADQYRAFIAAAPTPDNNGWRDISTAPRDGEWIMAWWPTMSITQYPCICYSDGSLSNPSAFETVATNEYGSEEVYPAKWQPLPPPPALDKGGDA